MKGEKKNKKEIIIVIIVLLVSLVIGFSIGKYLFELVNR